MTELNSERLDGRTVRPWILIIKIIAITIYVGGLATVFGLWMFSGFTSLELTDPRRELILHQVSRLMVFVVVPALLVTIICGFTLLLRNPRRFLRTNWLRVKLISLVILIPVSHLYCRMHFTTMRNTTDKLVSDESASRFVMGMIVALLGSIAVVVISRLKPKLGQTIDHEETVLVPSPTGLR